MEEKVAPKSFQIPRFELFFAFTQFFSIIVCLEPQKQESGHHHSQPNEISPAGGVIRATILIPDP